MCEHEDETAVDQSQTILRELVSEWTERQTDRTWLKVEDEVLHIRLIFTVCRSNKEQDVHSSMRGQRESKEETD